MAVYQESEFPRDLLTKLDEKLNRLIVPLSPKGELGLLLEAAIELSKKGLDTRNENCQRFFREGLTISFTKVLTAEVVNGWKNEIQEYILRNAKKLMELIVVKLPQDYLPLLELLAMVLNPHCKFHQHNESRPSESVPAGCQPADDELFARPPDAQSPKGWLVDLVNHFGQLNGFSSLLDRFTAGAELSVPVIAALIKPFGLCADVLIPHTIQKYFMPLVDIVRKFLDSLSNEELKKQSNSETENDSLSIIILTSLNKLVARVPGQEDAINNLLIFRLEMILRLQSIKTMDVISFTQSTCRATQPIIDELKSLNDMKLARIKEREEQIASNETAQAEQIVSINEREEQIASNETALAEKQSCFDKDIENFTTDLELHRCKKEELAKQIERMEHQNRISETKVCLDVGGHRFMTSTLTLAKYPDSMLGIMFSGRHPIIRESDGSIFIDRDGSHFGHILNFLRDGDNMASSIPNNQHSLHSIKQEAEYYQIPDLVNISEMKLKELERR